MHEHSLNSPNKSDMSFSMFVQCFFQELHCSPQMASKQAQTSFYTSQASSPTRTIDRSYHIFLILSAVHHTDSTFRKTMPHLFPSPDRSFTYAHRDKSLSMGNFTYYWAHRLVLCPMKRHLGPAMMQFWRCSPHSFSCAVPRPFCRAWDYREKRYFQNESLEYKR